MFRNHNINKKNIKNQYSITTSDHTSDNIFTTTISNQNDNDLNISSTSLYFNNQKFPASDGSNSQLLSTNGNGVLSWIDSVNLAHIDIVTDDSPQLGGDLSLNNNDITGTGNINITGSIQSSSSITCSDLTVNGSTTHINTLVLSVDDPLIYLGENNNGNTLDLGWYGKFNDGAVKYSGVIRDASSGKFKFFTTSTEPTTSVSNISLASIECDEITAGKLDVDNIRLNLNIISSTANNLKLNPASGSSIELDGTIFIDAGVVTGATSITSTSFIGGWNGDNLSQYQITDLVSDLSTITSNVSGNATNIVNHSSIINNNTANISTNTSNCPWLSAFFGKKF